MKASQVSGFIAGLVRGIFLPSLYEIKPGYRHRTKYIQYDDRHARDESQKEVYVEALRLMRERGCNSILDVGCGSGFKLVNYFEDYQIAGVEVSPTLEYLTKEYPQHNWYNSNEVDFSTLTADVVISADVIEHVIDPDQFMRRLLSVGNVKYFIISTPDRDTVRGKLDYGPPLNKHHIREWNLFEFSRFISRYLNIESHKLVNIRQSNQVVVCTRK